jgi:hypothetical protein
MLKKGARIYRYIQNVEEDKEYGLPNFEGVSNISGF